MNNILGAFFKNCNPKLSTPCPFRNSHLSTATLPQGLEMRRSVFVSSLASLTFKTVTPFNVQLLLNRKRASRPYSHN